MVREERLGKIIITKVCNRCGREYYWKTVENGEIIDLDLRTESISRCPVCGGQLDYNYHKVVDAGTGEPVFTYVKKCPRCGFEVKWFKITKGQIVDFNQKAEMLVRCPICGERLVVEKHDTIG